MTLYTQLGALAFDVPLIDDMSRMVPVVSLADIKTLLEKTKPDEAITALRAWKQSDDHRCSSCDEHGYGSCTESVSLTLSAARLQQQALAE